MHRPLTYWLDPALARARPDSRSVLRNMAIATATRLALAWVAFDVGALAIFGGLFFGLRYAIPAVLVTFVVLGLLLIGVGWLVRRAELTRSAPRTTWSPSRGPGNPRSGLGATLFFSVFFVGLITYALVHQEQNYGNADVVGGLGAMVVAVGFLASAFFVPGLVIGRAYATFRRRIDRDPALRQALERVAAEPGELAFGPL